MTRIVVVLLCCFGYCIQIIAQDCGGYLVLRRNARLEFTSINDHEAKQIFITSNQTSDSIICRGKLTSRLAIGKKAKNAVDMEWDVLYENNTLKIAASSLLPQVFTRGKKKGVDDKETADDLWLEYPTTMEVGQKFDNISYSGTGKAGSADVTTEMTVSNRKVIAKEKLTTPAGSWDCFKIKFEYNVKIIYEKKQFRNFNVDDTMTVTEWFAPNVGIVKSETITKDKKSTYVLTSVGSPGVVD